MNLFNQRKPKRFSYTPRNLKEHRGDDAYEFDPKWRKNTQRKKKTPTLLVLLVVLGMVIVIWYVLSNYEI